MLWWLLLWIPLALGLPLFVAQVWRARREADEAHRNPLELLADQADDELSRQVSENLNV